MRGGRLLGFSFATIIVAAGIAWAVWAFTNIRGSLRPRPVKTQISNQISPHSNRSTLIPAAKQAGDNSAFHFYSPLHDPPPPATPEQLKKWHEELDNLFLKKFTPDLNGPPLLSIYAMEAAKADNGDIQAGTALFKGLYYCRKESWGTIENREQLDRTITQMRETQTDRWAVPTANLSDSIAQTKAQYRYCAGSKSAALSGNLSSWAALAFRSSDPNIAMHAGLYMSGLDLGATTPLQLYEKQQEIIDGYAKLGVPYAWQLKWETDGVNKRPEVAYTDLYTEYLLTRSSFLAYKVWKLSRQLSPLQIEHAELQAQKNYRQIQSH